MSEAELFELIFVAGSTAMTAIGVYITFTFAYLTVAYFAGAALSGQETLIASALYVTSALMTFSVAMANISAMGSFQQELTQSTVYQNIIFFMDADIYLIGVPIIVFGGIGVCLYFMWGIRHPKTE